jgi:uncharacterized repeat protein (TIGR02543 family)
MNRFLKAVLLATATAMIVALPAVAQQTHTSSGTWTYNGYDYELWSQDNAGTTSMTLNGDNGTGANAKGGTFSATWQRTINVLFRAGRKFSTTSGGTISGRDPAKPAADYGNISVEFAATWSSTDNVKMLGIYGWAFYAQGSIPSNFTNQIEYYIIQDRGSYNSATSGTNSTKKGSATIDGIEYDFYVCDRLGQPMLTGNGNFKQYFSVPKNTSSHRTSGTISVSKHFSEWAKVGMKMDGPLYEVAMKVESYTGSGSNANGSATITKNILTVGGSATTGFTLTAVASPSIGGTVTKTPNSSTYTSGTSVQVTAVPSNSSWQFDGWSGDATGTANPATVSMNADKTVTAKFKLVADDTTNLVKDGKFSGSSLSSNWSWNTGADYGNSAGSSSVSGGKVKLTVTTPGSNTYEPQLIQQGISLEKGAKYRLTFTASAGAARAIEVGLQQSVSPWGDYAKKTYDLAVAEQDYKLEFEMTKDSDPATQLSFNVGGTGTAGTNVTISNVRLVQILNFSSPTGIATRSRPAMSAQKPALRATATSSGIKVSFKASEDGAAVLRLYSLKGDVLSAVNLNTQTGHSYSYTLRSGGKLPSGFYVVGLQRGGSAVERMSVLVP